MTYTVHMGASEDAARRASPLIYLDVQNHAVVFCQNKELVRQFPLFSGMSNYYGDMAYLGEEKSELRVELYELMDTFADNLSVGTFIEDLLSVTRRAIADDEEIYCFCS